jgi:GxxExxY protein
MDGKGINTAALADFPIPLPFIPLPSFEFPIPDFMPIHCPLAVASLSADDFEALDYRVMGHAYASQNELGRLCDECAYEADIKARLLADGFHSVQTQVPVTVTHREFSKTYRIDLVAEGALYELKTDANLISDHEAQLFNYMFLLGIQRGKLLNFGASKVQGKIIATNLTQDQRRLFTETTERWLELTPACVKLRQTICDLVQDWGAFLRVSLYEEALVHLLGATSNVELRIPLTRCGVSLGLQSMLLHAPGVAFWLTAVADGQGYIESHLRRLLALTDLIAIQWINLNHSRIEFTTIRRKAGE